MEKKLVVSPSPHIHSGRSTPRLMLEVLTALAPAFLVSVGVYGLNALLVTAVAVASCVLYEYLMQRFMIKGPVTVFNYSAVLTGVLLAFNLPSGIPLWMVVLGAVVAVGVGKMPFGGLGANPFNPALVGRVFLLLSFPVAMTSFPGVVDIDGFSGATPLAVAKAAVNAGMPVNEVMARYSMHDLWLGFKAGSFGEVSSLFLIAGFLWLLWRRVITWHIPVFVIGSMALLSGILWMADSAVYLSPVYHILTGGALLGAIFMATDYVTSPMNPRGMIIFATGIGVITVLIRVWGAYPEGMSFAILIMNAVVPLINKYVKPRRFGRA